MPLGPDTWRVVVGRTEVAGGVPEAQKVALSTAEQHCAAMGRRFVPVATEGERMFQVDFQCLAPGQAVQPHLQPSANVRVKVER
jgi:hypothetical protein